MTGGERIARVFSNPATGIPLIISLAISGMVGLMMTVDHFDDKSLADELQVGLVEKYLEEQPHFVKPVVKQALADGDLTEGEVDSITEVYEDASRLGRIQAIERAVKDVK